jgi:hypothetical protein
MVQTIFKTKTLLITLLFIPSTSIHIHSQTIDLHDLEQRLQKLENNNPSSNKIRIQGYIQTQFSRGEKDAVLRIGAPNENPEKPFNRIGIREGQISMFVQEGVILTNFSIDLTDKGIGVRNIFLQLNDPLWGTNSLRAGLFTLPFGYDAGYSSAIRESLQRSTIVGHLFPGERDLGTMLTLQAPQYSTWRVFRLNAGLFAGNGRNVAVDSRMNFIGRLSAKKKIDNITLSGGVSYYHGAVFQGTENVYTMLGNGFQLNNNPDNAGNYAKREYFGFDAQAIFSTEAGTTKIKTEYIFGQQPGSQISTASPNANQPPNYDTFIRPVSGGYVMLAQGLGTLPLSAVFKYDWYNPNTSVSGNDIGLNNTNRADLFRTAYGFGLLWNMMPNVRLKTYYEIAEWEKSSHIDYRFKGNSFNLRLQYRF